MQLLGLVEHPDHVCCRYRLRAFARPWSAEGRRLDLQAIPRGLWRRWRLWRSLRRANAVIVQRRLLSSFHLLMIRRHARRLIFDFDDAVFQRDSYTSKGNESMLRMRRFAAMMQAADAVVAGNEFLAAEARRYLPSDKVHVIPTCVDAQGYPLAQHRRSHEGIQLAWIGSSSTLQGLERRRPLIDALARRVRGLHLKVICDRFPEFREMPVLKVPWSRETEALALAEADIGISWVPDDRWSEGKCGLKVLQYMAAGLPVVANAVGVQARMVRHGQTGFLAETPEQWADAVRQLAESPDLRRRLGAAGRQLVEEEYSLAAGTRRWAALFAFLQLHPVRSAA